MRRLGFRYLLLVVIPLGAAVVLIGLALAGSGEDVEDPSSSGGAPGPALTPDGPSSTATVEGAAWLLPFAKRMEDALSDIPGIGLSITATSTRRAVSGLCAGTLEVALTGRPMTRAERSTCRENGIRVLGVHLGYAAVELFADGSLGVECLSAAELRRLWRPGSEVDTYAELRRELPDRGVRLLAPAADYGAFQLFTSAVLGEARAIRADARLVRDLSRLRDLTDAVPGALAFGALEVDHWGDDLGLEVEDVAVDFGDGCVRPTRDAVRSGAYEGLASPLYAYLPAKARKRRAIERIVDYLRTEPLGGYPGMVPVPVADRRRPIETVVR